MFYDLMGHEVCDILQNPGNIGNWILSFYPILERLEIEVSNILYNPGNIGNLSFLISHILEILEI